jgi:hypothetical protein
LIGVLGASEALSLTVVHIPLDDIAFVVSSQQFALSSVVSQRSGDFVVALCDDCQRGNNRLKRIGRIIIESQNLLYIKNQD